MVEPLVSVITITYNHEPFIGKTIEGVLSQQTDFPFEYIIAEDCSTDKTREIITLYAEKYTGLIRVITSGSNVGAVANETRALMHARGKYIAFCEGDDYWTDPLKLQKQVDLLEEHSDYSVCYHRCKNYRVNEDIFSDDNNGILFDHSEIKGVDIDYAMLLKYNLSLQTLTMVFRKDALNPNIKNQYKHYCDNHINYHLLTAGKGYLFSFTGGIRNRHTGGVFYGLPSLKRYKIALYVAEELYKINRAEILKKEYIKTLQWCINVYTTEHKKERYAFVLALRLFMIQKSFRRLGANVKQIFISKL